MLTVLIADDEPHILALVRATLEDEQVCMLEACDGVGAIDLAQTCYPDIVLLDVHIPGHVCQCPLGGGRRRIVGVHTGG